MQILAPSHLEKKKKINNYSKGMTDQPNKQSHCNSKCFYHPVRIINILPGLSGILDSRTVPNLANTSFRSSSEHCNTSIPLQLNQFSAKRLEIQRMDQSVFAHSCISQPYCTLKLRFLMMSLAFSCFFLKPFDCCSFFSIATAGSLAAK